MRQIIYVLLIVLIVLLASCNNESDNLTINSPQLPKNDGDYILYSVGDEVTLEQLDDEGIHMYGINNRSSHDFIEQYPKLDLEQSPAYLLFDKNGLNYRTYNYDKLIQYLKENPHP